MNRGIARRVVFDDQRAVRQFLASVARSVRRREIELIAYAILPTHYHLLVRSPNGELSVAMRRIQNEYVRWYNRDQRRDGPLFRGRFNSKLVFSDRYRFNLVRYIDRNATEARIVGDLSRYPFASARDYVRRVGPCWLSRGWVESFVCERSGCSTFRPADYERVFHAMDEDQARAFDAESSRMDEFGEQFEDLVESAPERVQDWMATKSVAADGGRARRSATPDPSFVVSAVRVTLDRGLASELKTLGLSCAEVDSIAIAGLSRLLCACRWKDVARILETSASTARRLGARHAELVALHASYAEWSGQAARFALTRTVPGTLASRPAGRRRAGG